MKKNLSILLVLFIISMVVFAGCSQPSTQEEKPEENAKEEVKEQYLTFTAGGVGGSWFIVAAGLNEEFEAQIPGLKTNIVPGGGVANPKRLGMGKEADIGLSYCTNTLAAWEGKGEYKNEYKDLRAIANLNINQYMSFLVRSNLGVKSFSDLKEKKIPLKISVGPRGSGSELMGRRVLEAHGITYEDIKSWGGEIQFTSPTDGVNAIRDGQANALSSQSPLGNPFVVDCCTSREMTFLPVEEIEALKKFGYSEGAIPAGIYKGQDEDVPSIYDSVILLANKNVDEELIYKITKIICENKDKWVSIHSMWKDFTPENAPNSPIPLHPGAEKYYKEKGLL